MRGAMNIPTAMLGELPVIAYGLLYLYKTQYAPEEKRWQDYYGFNRNGKWYLSYAAMLTGTALIGIALRKMRIGKK